MCHASEVIIHQMGGAGWVVRLKILGSKESVQLKDSAVSL